MSETAISRRKDHGNQTVQTFCAARVEILGDYTCTELFFGLISAKTARSFGVRIMGIWRFTVAQLAVMRPCQLAIWWNSICAMRAICALLICLAW